MVKLLNLNSTIQLELSLQKNYLLVESSTDDQRPCPNGLVSCKVLQLSYTSKLLNNLNNLTVIKDSGIKCARWFELESLVSGLFPLVTPYSLIPS